MARIDAVLHEGGGGPVAELGRAPDDAASSDDGVRSALTSLEAVASCLRKHHPAATVWMSPAGEDAAWMDAWYRALAAPSISSWLTGVSWGPVILGSETQMLSRLPPANTTTGPPSPLKVRLYPDICHTLTAMYPVPDWSYVWANTHGRQVVNPLPRHYADVIEMNTNASLRARSVGFGGYSEGAADDFNKALWSALYMEPLLSVEALADQYARHFFPEDAGAADGAALIFGLERNWVGDAMANTAVLSTLATADRLYESAGGDGAIYRSANWRLQSHLMRAYFDGYVQAKARFESQRERETKEAIIAAVEAGTCNPGAALAVLARPFTNTAALGWRSRTYALARAINISSSLCGGCEYGGMAVLESQNPGLSLSGFTLLAQDIPGWIDGPVLSDTVFLRSSLTNVSAEVDSVQHRCAALSALVGWEDPGAGGFYDQLGGLPRSPRLDSGFGVAADPQFSFAPMIQFDEDYTRWPMTMDNAPQRVAWHRYAQTYGDHPLVLGYDGLDTTANYTFSVVYAFAGFGRRPKSSLTAIGTGGQSALLHDFMEAPQPTQRISFAIPAAVTRGGELQVECHQPAGICQNGNGRGCQIAEVWLTRNA